MISPAPPFVLRLSKDERGFFSRIKKVTCPLSLASFRLAPTLAAVGRNDDSLPFGARYTTRIYVRGSAKAKENCSVNWSDSD